jgi:hypothetical protein
LDLACYLTLFFIRSHQLLLLARIVLVAESNCSERQWHGGRLTAPRWGCGAEEKKGEVVWRIIVGRDNAGVVGLYPSMPPGGRTRVVQPKRTMRTRDPLGIRKRFPLRNVTQFKISAQRPNKIQSAGYKRLNIICLLSWRREIRREEGSGL